MNKDILFYKKKTIKCNGQLLDLSTPKVMGILNLGTESFYDGNKFNTIDKVRDHINDMIREGADIIDIGAISSKPGSKLVNSSQEISVLNPILELISTEFNQQIFSLDTYNSQTAKHAVSISNISIINDISAGDIDPKMMQTIADLNIPYIMMHMQGKPENMQKEPKYEDVITDIIKYFAKKVETAKKIGIHDLILDPGFGFGKSLDHNYSLMAHLNDFSIFNLPVLVGISRKSMINKLLNCQPELALNGTTVLNTIALQNGANILRVHDVKEAKEAVLITEKTSSF